MQASSRDESSTRAVPVVRGLVLAGGASARLGRPKAGVRIAGRTLLERACAVVREATGRGPWISVAHGAARPTRACIADRSPDRGPAEGAAAGLDRLTRDGTGDALLIVGVDMPLLTADDLRRLLEAFAAEPGRPVVAAYRGRVQPMCCVLPKRARRAAESAADRGDGLHWILDHLGARPVAVPRRPGPSPFRSVNTPCDLAEIRAAIIRRARR